jgi:hypothetical protein
MLQHKYSTTQPHYNTNVKEHLHGITRKTSRIQHNVPTKQMNVTTQRLEIKTSIVLPRIKPKKHVATQK